jgi:hypothetical protein
MDCFRLRLRNDDIYTTIWNALQFIIRNYNSKILNLFVKNAFFHGKFKIKKLNLFPEK